MSKHSALNTFGRSGNPAFTKNFDNVGTMPQAERMTLEGAVNKTAILLSLCFGGAFIGVWLRQAPPTTDVAGVRGEHCAQ